VVLINNKKVKIRNKKVEAPSSPPKGEGFNSGILENHVILCLRGIKTRAFAPLRALRETNS
jgi:hypothetical protein